MILAENLPSGLASSLSRLAWHRLLLGSHYIPTTFVPGAWVLRHPPLGPACPRGADVGLSWCPGLDVSRKQQSRQTYPVFPVLSSPISSIPQLLSLLPPLSPLPHCPPAPVSPPSPFTTCRCVDLPGASGKGPCQSETLFHVLCQARFSPARSEGGGSFRESLNSEFWGNPSILESALAAGVPSFSEESLSLIT